MGYKVVEFRSGVFTHRKSGLQLEASETNPIFAYKRADGAWIHNGSCYSIRRSSSRLSLCGVERDVEGDKIEKTKIRYAITRSR